MVIAFLSLYLRHVSTLALLPEVQSAAHSGLHVMTSAGQPYILLTVPHARCSAASHLMHDCDYAATRMAGKISAALSSAGVKHEIVIGDINRRTVDLNRRESRYKAAFRERIRQLVTERSVDSRVFTLDIHSYPKHHQWAGTVGFPMVFLYAGGAAPAWVGDMAALIRKSTARSIGIIDGIGPVNDIQDELHALGFSAVLLEFNESNDASTEEQLAQAVKEWAEAL